MAKKRAKVAKVVIAFSHSKSSIFGAKQAFDLNLIEPIFVGPKSGFPMLENRYVVSICSKDTICCKYKSKQHNQKCQSLHHLLFSLILFTQHLKQSNVFALRRLNIVLNKLLSILRLTNLNQEKWNYN